MEIKGKCRVCLQTRVGKLLHHAKSAIVLPPGKILIFVNVGILLVWQVLDAELLYNQVLPSVAFAGNTGLTFLSADAGGGLNDLAGDSALVLVTALGDPMYTGFRAAPHSRRGPTT